MGGRFEFLEHTADIGIRARGKTLEEVFEAAAEGLANLVGVWFPGEGDERPVEVESPDEGALLVAWMDELVFLHEAEGAGFGEVRVDRVSGGSLEGRVRLVSLKGRRVEGVGVKAATYHRLRVEQENEGWIAEVYLDV
ncbi:MAG: archease [Actinomycetota bacterium]